jgi:HSP20 family molecular chaperone IbpA
MATQNQLTQPAEAQVAERLRARQTLAPPVDIYENDSEVLLIADLPGVNIDALSIQFNQGELLLEARRENGHGNLLAGDQGPYDYARTFRVSELIAGDKIHGELQNGVLRLHLPKTETAKPRRITVRAG